MKISLYINVSNTLFTVKFENIWERNNYQYYYKNLDTLSPTKILRNERKNLHSSSMWASFVCFPETRKCQGDSTNPFISFFNEIYWKSHSSTPGTVCFVWLLMTCALWLPLYLFETCFFIKTMEGSTQFHTAISHGFPSKEEMNQTSLLAHNNKTPLSKRPPTLWKFMKNKEIKWSSKTDSTGFWTNLNASATASYP